MDTPGHPVAGSESLHPHDVSTNSTKLVHIVATAVLAVLSPTAPVVLSESIYSSCAERREYERGEDYDSADRNSYD
jgi:hypothetical protein